MNRNLIWKPLLIVLLVLIAAWNLYPPQDKLKKGIDIGGGTSLIYDIDTTGLSRAEQQGLAQRMIPILLKRIDPTNVANIVIRPQGDTRIEIQLPMATPDTQKRRKAYEDALNGLEAMNVNLLRVKRALSLEGQERQAAFDEFAAGDEDRKAILDQVAQINDQLKAKQAERDRLNTQRAELKKTLDSEGLRGGIVETRAPQWAKMSDEARNDAIRQHVENSKPELKETDPNEPADPNTPSGEEKLQPYKALVNQYVDTYENWAQTVDDLTEPETGLNARWNDAAARLTQLNLDTALVTDVLEMDPKLPKRAEYIQQFKDNFPERADKIDAVVQAFDAYRTVGGRLDDPEDLKRMLRGAGVLEFRILPTFGDGKSSESELEARLEELAAKGPKLGSDARYVWCEIENIADFRVRGAVIGQFGEKFYVLASNQKNEAMLHSSDKPWKLKRARHTVDEVGRRAISFELDDTGGAMFYTVTRNNVNRPLCILLDDVAFSAPNINTAIRGSGIIEGEFSQSEQDDMVNKLNAGSFPARLSDVPVSEKTIGSTLGHDNLMKGIRAGLIGMAAVAAFMVIYYLIAGAVADVALLMNVLFILAMMAMFRATFTLPGIAGLILTIGMSVDANVLIFERIREEQERGSSLRTAIANGYQRAFRTIFDANITTFFVALILYMVASEEIKGFAIVLMLGIVSSLFTALFVTRVVFDLLAKAGAIRDRLVMLRLIRKPTIDWMALRPVFTVISLVLIGGGMFVFFTRDESTNSKYDIEFTGGTSVQITLKDEFGQMTRDEVEAAFRNQAQQMGNSDLAAAKVYRIGETGAEYEITTTETNKTVATVTFADADETTATVRAGIVAAAEELNSTLYNLQVATADSRTFTVSTSQVNKAMVAAVLNEAFAEKAQVSEPVVDEVVSHAVREAFAGRLKVRQDLGLRIVEEQRVSETEMELADYLGGIKLTAQLDEPARVGEIRDRINELRFKPDADDLAWYRWEIFSDSLGALDNDDSVKTFVYATVYPEAGYRELSEDEWSRFAANARAKLQRAGSMETTLARVTQIDPSIGSQAKTQALVAIILSLAVVVAYIWIRFGTASYGLAAIMALVHDVAITLGAVTVCTYLVGKPLGNALLVGDFKIDLQMIAAFLTIIGYSLNDTIVVFDRIRENRGKLAKLTPQIITESINQTLSRTLLTSFTTFMVVFIMYVWGGERLRGFTFAMLVGIIVGTYSSIAIAAPMLLWGRKADTSKLKK